MAERGRLLFLIADTGGGHRASATAVARNIEASYPGALDVRIVDPFASGAPGVFGRTAGLYGPMTQNARWLWGALYHATNSRAAVSFLDRTVLRLIEPRLRSLVDEFRPDAVVSFHPLLNHVGARAAHRRGLRRLPMLTVITDLVDVHAFWACRDVDAVAVPSPGGLDRCRRAGIAASQCFEYGLPVDSRFHARPPSSAERAVLRARLGVPVDGFLALVCGGADGSGGIPERARALAHAGLDAHVAVICGRNPRALKALRGLRNHRGDLVPVHGFVSNMAEWVRSADVVVTKAGPGTIAEALCCGVPLLLTWYLPGQERGNVEWVVDIGAGRYVPQTQQLVDTIGELSAEGSEAMQRMRDAVARAARPEATARIADLIVGFTRVRAAPSVTPQPSLAR